MKYCLLCCCLFTLQLLLAQGGPQAHHSLQQRTFAGGSGLFLDTPQWRFDAAAPVRSTPLLLGNTVYVGTTRGDFLALDKKTGRERWRFSTGRAINASAASSNGLLFFADNSQTLYALHAATGKLAWKYALGAKKAYPWRFDYFYSSPLLHEGKLFMGGDDGYVHALLAGTGKLLWKYRARTVVRSSPAVQGGLLLVGDMEGRLVALDKHSGREQWHFSTVGDTLKNEDWGFDRKAILSSPVVVGNRILFGCRDGYLYCINKEGQELWRVNHNVSWAISTVAVKDSFVVTGTSDGRFVQAVHLQSGRELWKFRPNALFWSSPAIVDQQVYIGSFDGVLYCLDLQTGRRLSQFNAGDKILSSAVYSDGLLYVGADDGQLYALKGSEARQSGISKKYVYYQAGVAHYFRGNADLRIRNYLVNHGYTAIGADTLEAVMKTAAGAVVVFASNYFPPSVINRGRQSPLRQFLDGGGRVVLLGVNPLLFQFDHSTRQAVGFNMPAADTVLGLRYGHNDTRGMGGQFPCFATAEGRALNLPAFWVASTFLPRSQADVVLGLSENGEVSAFVKHYGSAGRLLQLFLHPDLPTQLDAVLKAAEVALPARKEEKMAAH